MALSRNDYFNIFGIGRRRVASFEEPVKKLGDKRGRIDLFWRGTLLVKHKSKGKNIDKSYTQTLEYFPGLKETRLKSTFKPTRELAEYPTLFREENRPDTFIIIPRVTSERRQYIPIGVFDKDSIASDTCHIVPNGDLFLFGQLTSLMHMAWVKYTCGRLKSDYRYSKDLVYNNYPFPKDVSTKNTLHVEKLAQDILDIRAEFTDSSLADLYDPLAMSPRLKKAHQALDKVVDKCYVSKTFKNDKERIEFLFELYESYLSEI